MKVKATVKKVQDENSRVKGYAWLEIENCCSLSGTMVLENSEGELYVKYPQKPVFENGEPKLHEDGKQVYSDVYYGNSKEVNDAIKELVLKAYNSPEGYAYINPAKGEFVNARIEPQLHACNGDTVKAAGKLLVGGYMKVTDVFVHLRTDKQGDQFLSVSYPHYQAKDDTYRDLVEPMEKGKVWDTKEKVEKDCNFKAILERTMKKQTREFHPELANLAEGKVQDAIDEAKAAADKANGQQGKETPEKEAAI